MAELCLVALVHEVSQGNKVVLSFLESKDHFAHHHSKTGSDLKETYVDVAFD